MGVWDFLKTCLYYLGISIALYPIYAVAQLLLETWVGKVLILGIDTLVVYFGRGINILVFCTDKLVLK